jgi:hypothetical protein
MGEAGTWEKPGITRVRAWALPLTSCGPQESPVFSLSLSFPICKRRKLTSGMGVRGGGAGRDRGGIRVDEIMHTESAWWMLAALPALS